METNDTSPLTPEEEAELQKEVDLAISTYEGLAPPALLQRMRENLEQGMRTNPATRSLLRRLAPRPVMASSGEVTRDGAAASPQAAGGKEGT